VASKSISFRVGRVSAYQRGRVWYLCYYEHGQRRRPRIGPDKDAARRLAAQTNSQLELGGPTPMSFEPLTVQELRTRWLEYHENVLRSSVATVRRYRTASQHLVGFLTRQRAAQLTSHFRAADAEAFAAYLRRIEVAPNGHARARKRPLRDKGIKYILEVCRSLFNYAARRCHLPPYAPNPFQALQIDRIPIENAKPFVGFNERQELVFFERMDDWQFPVFLTLRLTGMRPGELAHLLLPDDLDLDDGWINIVNKWGLGWQIKTRNERRIPIVPELVAVLREVIGLRETGPVFLRRRFNGGSLPPLGGFCAERLRETLHHRLDAYGVSTGVPPAREQAQDLAIQLWRDMGMVETDEIRIEFMKLTRQIGLPHVTAPKTLRHMFATGLQDANVDPLIRTQLMGHAPVCGGIGTPLGMTGVYTHTRPETMRRQLTAALEEHMVLEQARRWVRRQ
jgi:integrase